MNYYNDLDPSAAKWLQALIDEGLIPNGKVDCRSIRDVQSSDLRGFTQAHFFAGIGGWPLALQLAGWPSNRPIWTGSCPCQPFSAAGKQGGTADERHLWPEFARLIRACKPPTVVGEQVASKLGRNWLAGVFADLEDMGYQRAGADVCAAGLWATANAQDGLKATAASHNKCLPADSQLAGPTPSTTYAATTKAGESRPVLNPYFSAWLMGYPPIWTATALKAFRSLRKGKSSTGRSY